MAEISTPEMSRPLGVDKIPAGGIDEHIVARPSERVALAARFGLLELARFEADFSVQHAENKMVSVTGHLDADVVQQCVVTLEPMPGHVSEKVDVLYAPERYLAEMEGGEGGHVDVGLDDEIEPLVDGVIDLGELAAQHLALALDPYPRKAGAALPKADALPLGANNPFAQLRKKLKTEEKA